MGIKVQRSEKVSAVVFTVSVGRGGGGGIFFTLHNKISSQITSYCK